jgi:hypothetical protein
VSPQRRARVLLVAGSVLLLGSVAVFLLVPQSFGSFAYAPLTETAFTPRFGFLDPTHRWAAVVGLASVVVASWAAGYLAGRRAK